MLKPPFYGRGIAFPFRLNAAGGIQITEGRTDVGGIGLEMTPDGYSIREDKPDRTNHVAEAVSHILLVRPGEHDTLPEFGSRLFTLVSKPNNWQTRGEFETWLDVAIERWEHRARVPIPDGIKWPADDYATDQNICPSWIGIEMLMAQAEKNLVSPFVDPRRARSAEYPYGDGDEHGHDWCSRYARAQVYLDGQIRYIRPRRMRPIRPRYDDLFYQVVHYDTWYLISYRVYGDIRWAWIITDCYVQDAAERGEPRSQALDNCIDPEPGTLLRMPSRARLLMELAA